MKYIYVLYQSEIVLVQQFIQMSKNGKKLKEKNIFFDNMLLSVSSLWKGKIRRQRHCLFVSCTFVWLCNLLVIVRMDKCRPRWTSGPLDPRFAGSIPPKAMNF
jgi:hypothetical protein